MVIAAPALVETYAMLTRLPPPNWLAPLDCWALLEENVVDTVEAAGNAASPLRSDTPPAFNLTDCGDP